MVMVFVSLGFSQVDLAQQAYAIFERSCLNCHGPHGAFTEAIIIDHASLIETGVVIPRKPGASTLYQRLIEKRVERRMPLGQPPLSPAAITTVRQWILAGAPNWETPEQSGPFITPKKMLETIEKHVNSLAPFDRTYARYFTMTHLYNAGETVEALHAYQRALSKLVNSLSWERKVIKPKPIDPEETIFYIDLRDYEWEIGTNRWTQIEQVYPYSIEFDAPTQTSLRQKLTSLSEKMNCEVPFVHVDWFLATASLPPLYHDILDLPETDRELEARLEVNVVENLRNAAGRRVWRAGFNDSGVSNYNRVVERHTSRYGAYWKSYDFAGSIGTQNIFTHPLSFTHDGGEIIFNLPNGLQAYYLADAGGNRLDAAPINIVSNPAASDPTVRNGLSCIGCHTEGMKDFEDQVHDVVKKNPKPPFDKDRALRLYTEQATMDALLDEDTARYRQALEAAGVTFGGIEPIQRFYEAFWSPLSAAASAAAVGLEAQPFLRIIRSNRVLQSLGLLVLENGTIKRDAWTSNFTQIVFALDFPTRKPQTIDLQEEVIPGATVHIPDPNLRAAIEDALGKVSGLLITAEEMATLTRIVANDAGIRDLTGLQFATDLEFVEFRDNAISDLSHFAGLTKIVLIGISGNQISDLSPLSGLIELRHLSIHHNPEISDLSPLKGLRNLNYLSFVGSSKISDISPLAGLTSLKTFLMWGSPISDLSPLKRLTNLENLDICGSKASDISQIAKLTGLKELYLNENGISDVSPLRILSGLTHLSLAGNEISDLTPLAPLRDLKWLALQRNEISSLSALGPIQKTVKILWHENPGFPKGGPKIEGPWLWVTVPGKELSQTKDLLSEASGGTVTENKIATHGATEGASVGESVWQSHALAQTGHNNIGDMLTALGDEPPIHPDYTVYGVVTLYSPRKQNTTMFAGSDTNHKVWLNGELVNQNLNGEWAHAYENFFPVTLKKGTNILLVSVDNSRGWGWSGYFGFKPGADYTVSNPRLYTFSEPIIHVGDTFTLDLSAEDVYDLAGWQFDITFNPNLLQALEIREGSFLKKDGESTFYRKGVINNREGEITRLSSARLSGAGVNGEGTLLSVTFRAIAGGESLLKLNNFQFGSGTGGVIPTSSHEVAISIEGQLATGDVNRDGSVSILDMILVAQYLGEAASANPEADVNGDGVISILDLIAVASSLGESTDAAAPLVLAFEGISELDPVRIQTWIEQASLENDGSIAFGEGIAKLESLLALLIPKETVLLANYPNPFNPETWIPYQLAEDSDVAIVIYDMGGIAIRRLALGHQPAGDYTSRRRAAYWDGRNALGEHVASGLYFYTLTAGEYTATRKMLIRK